MDDGWCKDGRKDGCVGDPKVFKLEAEFRGHVIQHTLVTLPLSIPWLCACDLGR